MDADTTHPAAAVELTASYIPTLDGWRAVAICVVMAQHAADQVTHALGGQLTTLTDVIRENGRFGVYVFFAISGYLICSRLLVDEQRCGRIDLGEFYLRRAFRIIPPLVVVLATFGVLGMIGVIPIPFGRWLASLLFVNNYVRGGSWYLGHFWSLAIEEHFYLLWPPLLVWVGRTRALRLSVVLVIAVSVWRYIDLAFSVTEGYGLRFDDRTDVQFDGLMWGCILAIVCLDPQNRLRLAQALRGGRYWAVLALVVITQAPDLSNALLEALQLTLRPLLMSLLVVGTILHATSPLGRTLERPTMRRVGRISYSLYLWQQLFLAWDAFEVTGLRAVQWFPLSVACALACATASHVLIERPMMRTGKRLAERRRARCAVPLAPGAGPAL